MKKILDVDKESKTTQIFHANEHDQTYTVETVQDVSEIIKNNDNQRNETDKHTPYGDGMTKVASIPMSIYAEWLAKGYTRDQKKMKKLLNSPELKRFRTREGRV